jgi:Fe-S-cluster containining protein
LRACLLWSVGITASTDPTSVGRPADYFLDRTSLNEARFRQFVLAEYDAEPAEKRRRNPQEALLRFYGRQDAAIDKTIRAAKQKVACRSGCSTCCHYKVEARAVEVLAIRDYVNAHFSPAQRASVVERAEHNVAEAADWSHVEHLARNQRCPLLIDDACSVYPVRPANCRSFHSTDVQVCIESRQRPEDLSIRVPYIEEVFEAATATVAGFVQAARQAHLDVTLYDLDSAFLEAMRDSTATDRLLSGAPVFRAAKVIGSPPA